ncbi:MAG: hypothetical protein KBA06_02020 [Saprospiraceae bacterium]|nr:hypothetical protein [Saprospiraceae bacterium]
MENNNAQTLKFGDISVIRDILMGQHIAEFQEKFDKMEQMLSETEIRLTNKIQELDEKTNQNFVSAERNNSARFQTVEKLLKDTEEQLRSTIEKVSKEDKAKIGRYLSEIGKKLQEG